jgi:hypothetical protein
MPHHGTMSPRAHAIPAHRAESSPPDADPSGIELVRKKLAEARLVCHRRSPRSKELRAIASLRRLIRTPDDGRVPGGAANKLPAINQEEAAPALLEQADGKAIELSGPGRRIATDA